MSDTDLKECDERSADTDQAAEDRPDMDWIIFTPIWLLLPTSLIYLILDSKLAVAGGGRDSFFYHEVADRWIGPLVFVWYLGTFVLFAALFVLINKVRVTHRWNGLKFLWLLLGALSHPLILVIIWDKIEKMLS